MSCIRTLASDCGVSGDLAQALGDRKDFDSLLREFMTQLWNSHRPPLDRTCDWGQHLEALGTA